MCRLTHILRSDEFHAALQDRIRVLFGFKPIVTSQFTRFNFKGTPVQKRLLRPLVQKKVVSGWDDPRMPTIEGVRRRGILAEAIRQFTLQVGYNKSEHEYDWSLLFSVNRKLLDPVTKRYFFVPNPVKVRVEGAPSREAEIPFHPDKALGSRKIKATDGEVWMSKDDLAALKVGELFRFMELYNVRLVSNDQNGLRAAYAGDELVRESRKLQWAGSEHVGVKVLEPSELYNEDGSFNEKSLKVTEGIAEAAYSDLAEGEIIQFQRYGFCRVHSKNVCILAHR